jgi:hypothetical protein
MVEMKVEMMVELKAEMMVVLRVEMMAHSMAALKVEKRADYSG